jgi:hypothetical protein
LSRIAISRPVDREAPLAMEMEPDKHFKECTMCGKVWPEREEFLRDRDVRVSGYIAHFKELELGLFLFNHEPCKSTLAVKAKRFIDLVTGPVFIVRMTGTEECPGYCLHKTELRPCPAKCECAHVRDVLDRVARWGRS